MSVIPNNLFKYKNSTGTSNVSTSPPPGSIIAYLGTTDPDGWVMCNGTARTDGSDGRYNNLINMNIGTGTSGNYTPPNYTGAFLRGSGSQTYNTITYSGPDVKTGQSDDYKLHNHGVTDGGHQHTYGNIDEYLRRESLSLQSNGGPSKEYVQTKAFNPSQYLFNQNTSYVSSNITVNSSGGSETRPFNYGVNWIIKL